jgi:antitoxin ParD1/3/4
MHVNLTPGLERFIREQIRRGLYGNASEVVREALRLLVQREQERSARQRTRRKPIPATGDGRLREALELVGLAHALMEQNLKREFPEGSEVELARARSGWLFDSDRGEETPGHLERSPERLARLLRDGD